MTDIEITDLHRSWARLALDSIPFGSDRRQAIEAVAGVIAEAEDRGYVDGRHQTLREVTGR